MKKGKDQNKRFTKAELNMIKEAPLSSMKDIAFMLNRTEASVRRKKWMLENPEKDKNKKLEYRRKLQAETLVKADANNSRWTKAEEEELLNSTLPDTELAIKLGRTLSAIQVKRLRLQQETTKKKKKRK
jgi:hypothetical protein